MYAVKYAAFIPFKGRAANAARSVSLPRKCQPEYVLNQN